MTPELLKGFYRIAIFVLGVSIALLLRGKAGHSGVRRDLDVDWRRRSFAGHGHPNQPIFQQMTWIRGTRRGGYAVQATTPRFPGAVGFG